MSVSDFLFNGQPPPSVTTYGESFQDLPAWYSDYVKGMMSTARGFATDEINNPSAFQFQGPRVAGFNRDSLDAFAATRTAANSHRPMMDQAQSAISGGMRTFPGAAAEYMNPYTDQVVDRIGTLAQRNLTENLLPNVNDNFVRAGQFGSDRQGEFTARAVRDANESALNAQASALQQGYAQAGTQFTNDQNRMVTGGQNMSQLAQTGQALDMRGAAALDTVGQQQQAQQQRNLDVAYGDFQTERDRPFQLLQQQNAILRGMNVPTATTATQTGPAQAYAPSPLTQLAQAGLTMQSMSQPRT